MYLKYSICVLIYVLLIFPTVGSRNQCPQLQTCFCHKARIACWNIMEIPRLPLYIQRVELSNNAITELKRSDFSHNNITELFLGSNQISKIDEDAFYDLSELIHLNLSNNKLQALKKRTFKNNQKLKQLHLDNNLYLVFSTNDLPANVEDVNLFNTSSTMSCCMQNLVELRKYQGNLRLSGNCSHSLQLQDAISKTEDLNVNTKSILTTKKTDTPPLTTAKPKALKVEPRKSVTECENCYCNITLLGLLILMMLLLIASCIYSYKLRNELAATTPAESQEDQNYLIQNNQK